MEEKKKCAVCKETIHSEAQKCPHCDSHQSKLKRNFIYYGSIVGIITLSMSAIAYVLDTYNKYSKRYNPIKIERYSYKEGAVFLNQSFDKLYVHSIFILANNDHSLYTEPLNILLKPQDIVTHHKPIAAYGIYPNKLDEKHWEQAWENKSKCFDIFFSLNEKKHAIKAARATINYVNAYDGKPKMKKFDVGVFLKVKDKNECKNFGHAGSLFN